MKTNFSIEKMNLLEKAIVIATEAHKGQVDKGGNPYILHPLRVMTKMNDLTKQVVAVLHDIIEDTFVTPEYLKKQDFPNEIVEAVLCLTRREGEDYIDFILRCKQNKYARIVKIADLQDNMDISRIPNPTEKDFKRLTKYKTAMKMLLTQ